MPDDQNADERLDARLHRAGEAWRSVHDTSVAVLGPVEDVSTPASTPHRTRRLLALTTAAVVAAALVAVGWQLRGLGHDRTPSADTGKGALTGVVWQLRGYGDQDDPNSSATFYVDGHGQLVADDTCEVIGGRATVGRHSLDVTRRVVRYRSCTDSVGETTFTPGLALLRGHSTYSVDGDELTISSSGHDDMHLTAAPGTPPPTLDVPTFVGAHWRLVSIKDGAGTTSVTQDISFHVTDDGRYATSDGCNDLTGRVAGDGPGVTFHPGAVTEIGCVYAGRIDAVVQGRVTELVGRGALTLTKQSVGTLTYRWVPNDRAATNPARLYDTEWTLTQVAGDAADGPASLSFDRSGAVTGSDECHALQAHADVHHGTMSVTGIEISTARPGCPVYQSSTVESLLGGDVLWSVRDGNLVINDGDAQAFSLTYAAAGAASDKPLVGTKWTLISIENGGRETSRQYKLIAVALFLQSAGKFDLAQVCTSNSGTSHIGPSDIAFAGLPALKSRQLGSDPGGCLSFVTEAAGREFYRDSALVHGVLNGVATWTVSGTHLVLRRGRVTLTFRG